MKVAFVTNPLDSTFKSSISIVTLELAKRLLGEGFGTAVYTGAGRENAEPPAGIEARRLLSGPDRTLRRLTGRLSPLYGLRRPFFSSGAYYPVYMLQLAADLRRTGFDIVHIHNFTQFLPAVKALNPGLRIVLHMHSEWLTQLDRRLIGRRLRHADLILSCSECITDATRRAFPELAPRCATLHNGVDTCRFRPSGGRKMGPGIELLAVGRITPEKGLHVLIDAFNRVAPRHPGLRLTVVGQERITPREFLVDLSDDAGVRSLAGFYPGSYGARIMERLDPALKDRVSFPGHVSHQEMSAIYARSAVFVNSSYYESFGMPVAEAMASGLPVIASRVGGVPEIIEDGRSGLLVAPGDSEWLAAAIERVIGDEGLRLGLAEAGKRRIEERFNWDVLSRRLAGHYRAVMDA